MKNRKFEKDYERLYNKKCTRWNLIKSLIKSRNCRFMYLGRLDESFVYKGWGKLVLSLMINHYKERYGLEISLNNCGSGLVLTHPYNITINGGVKVGENCTIFKGVTIGSVRSGKRKGVPIIGSNVVLCTNCFIAGNCVIGNDVLIAANAFVNFDVPDHSIVIGNPGLIKHKEDVNRDYM